MSHISYIMCVCVCVCVCVLHVVQLAAKSYSVLAGAIHAPFEYELSLPELHADTWEYEISSSNGSNSL